MNAIQFFFCPTKIFSAGTCPHQSYYLFQQIFTPPAPAQKEMTKNFAPHNALEGRTDSARAREKSREFPQTSKKLRG